MAARKTNLGNKIKRTVKGRLKTVRVAELRPGPIRRDSLGEHSLSCARRIHAVLGKHIGPFETFELAFLRDLNPEQELAIWAAMAVAYQAYAEKYGPLTEEQERQVYAAIVYISVSADRPANITCEIWNKVSSEMPGGKKDMGDAWSAAMDELLG